MATIEAIVPADTAPDEEEKKDNAEREDDNQSSGPNDAEPWTILDKDESWSDKKVEKEDGKIPTGGDGEMQDIQHISLESGACDEGKIVIGGENVVINEEKADVIEEREVLTYKTNITDQEKENTSGKIEIVSEEKEDVSENTGPASESTGDIKEEKETVYDNEGVASEKKEDVIESTGTISEESGLSMSHQIINESSEDTSQGTEVINEKEQTITEKSEAVNEETAMISEEMTVINASIEIVSDKDVKEENETTNLEMEAITKGAIIQVLCDINKEKEDTYQEEKDISMNEGDLTESKESKNTNEEKTVMSDIEAVSEDSNNVKEENETISGEMETICLDKEEIVEVSGDINQENRDVYEEMECENVTEEIQDHEDFYDDNERVNTNKEIKDTGLEDIEDTNVEYSNDTVVEERNNTSLEYNKIETLGPCDEDKENEIVLEADESEEHDTSNYFLSGLMVALIAIVLGLSMGHFLGLIVSLITNISPGLLGLGPDPDAGPNFVLGVNPSDYNSNHDEPSGRYSENFIDPNTGLPAGPSPHLRKNRKQDIHSNIGVGVKPSDYNNNPDTVEQNTVLGDDPTGPSQSYLDGFIDPNIGLAADSSDLYNSNADMDQNIDEINNKFNEMNEEVTSDSSLSSFHCMGLDDEPILVDGSPAVVSDPMDCHQYFHLAKFQSTHMDTADIVNPDHITETAGPADKADPADITDTAVIAGTNDLTDPAGTDDSASTPYPTDPADPARTTNPTYPAGTNDLVDPAGTNNPGGKSDPSEPAGTTDPGDPTGTVDPTDPPDTHSTSRKRNINDHITFVEEDDDDDDKPENDDDEDEEDDDEEQDDEEQAKDNEGKRLLQFLNYLSTVIGDIVRNIVASVKEGQVNFNEAKRLVESLKENAAKFDKMAHTSEFKKHVSETHSVTLSFGKGLIEAVKKLSEGGKKPKESELNKFKYQLEKHWKNTEDTYKRIIEDITAEENEVKNVLEFTDYLSGVIGNIVKNIVQEGQVNFKEAKRLVESLKVNAGKFDKMAHTNKMKKQVSEIQKVTANFGKQLVEEVKKLSLDGKKPKESDLNKFNYQLEKNWRSTEETYKKIIKDITGDDRYKNKNNKNYEDKHKKRKEQKHFSETKKNVEYKYKNSQNDDDDHYKNQKSKNDNRKDYQTKNHKYHSDDDDPYKDQKYHNGEDDHYKNKKYQNDNRKEGKHIKKSSKIKGKYQNEEYMRKNT